MKKFVEITLSKDILINWPSENFSLRTAPEKFFARTRANSDYGKPGWTRDCGKRFHRGCDITPIRFTPLDEEVTVWFTDCETGKEFESREPMFTPLDEIFSVYDGVVDEVVLNEQDSDFGLHIVVRHLVEPLGDVFYTLYGHLSEVDVRVGDQVDSGQKIGTMGCTSRISDAKIWMSIAPHLHFEVWDQARLPYDPAAFLWAYLPK
jgi:hypothetical protein